MQIPEDLRKKLVSEIRFVVGKIRTEQDLRTRTYYLSGIHGEMLRLVNINFDPHLLFAHNVLNAAFTTIRGRADAIVLGRDIVINFPPGFFDKLSSLLDGLATSIELDKELYKILQDISNLAYIGTGNGYYLFQKGIIKL